VKKAQKVVHPLQDAEFSSLLLLTTTTTTNVENWCNNCNSRNKTKLKEKIPHFFSEFLPKLSSLQDCRVAAAAVSKKKSAARDAENPSTYLHATNSTHCKQTHHKQRNQLCSLPSFLPAGEIQQIQLGFCSLKRELRNSELQKRLEEQMGTSHVVTTLAHGRHFSCTKKTTTLHTTATITTKLVWFFTLPMFLPPCLLFS
jgi:hypothetical protein